jgi:hypothetical protein
MTTCAPIFILAGVVAPSYGIEVWFQVSAQPPAKNTAGLIEKET